MLECPDIFTVEFGRQLVAELGGDPSKIKDDWCWKQFGENFKDLVPKAEMYLASATTGNPAEAAYMMYQYCGSSREWAEGVIASATTGNPANAAYWMCCNCGSSREWAKGVKTRIKTQEENERVI